MKRILHLDRLQKGSPVVGTLVTLVDRSSIDEMVQKYFALEQAPELFIDALALDPRLITAMLKFIEEYTGDISLLIKEPAPLPILSRFIEVRKKFTMRNNSVNELLVKNCSPNIRTKIETLFGIVKETY